jgi:hypothetical protein
MCKNPVGDGAKRTVTVILEGWGRRDPISTDQCEAARRIARRHEPTASRLFQMQYGQIHRTCPLSYLGLYLGHGRISIRLRRSGVSTAALPPCRTVSGKLVPVGTIAYRSQDTPNTPQHGIIGSHYNLYRAHQNPNNGRCFWQSIGAVRTSELPRDAIAIEPFAT